MQDQKIGKHCQICNRKDYIPYTCNSCHKILCDEDYWSHPCVAQKRTINQKQNPQTTPKKKQYRCSLTSCNTKIYTVNHFYCRACGKLFCLSHRMPEQHKCNQKEKKDCQLI